MNLGKGVPMVAANTRQHAARSQSLPRTIAEVLGLAALVLVLLGGGTALAAYFDPALTQVVAGSFASSHGADYLFHLDRAVSPQRPAATSVP